MSRTGPSGAARGPGDEERSKVGLGEYGLTATDLADAVHLAAVMKHATDTATRKRHGDFPAGETPFRDRPEEDAPTFTDKAERSSVRGGTARPRRRTGVEERRSSPAPEGGPMFSDTWGIAPFSQEELEERTRFLAALSPFNIKRPEGPENQVDREATARNYARALLDSVRWGENGEDEVLFLPSTGSRKRRAVSLTVLVDRGVSMLFHRSVVDGFTSLLRSSGVFRGVRELWFDSARTGAPVPMGSDGRVRGLREPGGCGPHLTVILSDGLGTAWRDRDFQEWVAGVARRGAVAIIHLLQPQLWRRSAIRAVPTQIRVAWPAGVGGPNTGYLREKVLSEADRGPSGTFVPVLPLSPEALHDWASFTMVRSRSLLWVHVAEFPSRDTPLPPTRERAEPVVLSPAENVLMFQRTAGPEAFELAVALAAVPLRPDVVTAVCEDVLGRPSPSELTEVFFSGLVRLGAGGPDQEPEQGAQWEFRPGVRRELLALGGRVPDIRRMLRIAVEVMEGSDPWFDDLALMLDGQRVGTPRPAPSSRFWAESMLPAVESVSIGRHYRDSVNAYSGRPLSTERIGVGVFGGNDVPEDHSGEISVPVRRGDEFSSSASDVQFSSHKAVRGEPEKGSTDRTETDRKRTHATEHSRKPGRKRHPFADPPGGEVMTGPFAQHPSTDEHIDKVVTGGRPLSAVWAQVPHRNAAFMGREGLLTTLRAHLLQQGQQAITVLRGTSGIGKTELAKEYLYRHAADYDLICWIPSAHPNQVRNSFSRLAADLRLAGAGASSEYVVDKVLETLCREDRFRRWLLVYDNARSRTDVQRFLPVGGRGHVIVTSEDSGWELPKDHASMTIREFDRDESIRLLKRRGPESLTESEADRLAEELGDLPLALDQAAVRLHESGMHVGQYLEHFFEKKEEMLRLLGPEDPGCRIPVAAAWNLSLDHLAVTAPGALFVLQLCSFLGSAPIPRYLFEYVRGVHGPAELVAVLEDPAQLGRALRVIGRDGLAHIDHQRNTILVHCLVQKAVRAPLGPVEREELRRCAHQLLGRGGPGKDPDKGGERHADLLPHVWASRAWESNDPWTRRVVITMCRLGVLQGQAQEAIGLCEEAHASWRADLGEEHPDTLAMALHTSGALRALGKLDKSREMCERTLKAMRRTVGQGSPDLMEAEHEHVRNLRVAGRFHTSLEESTKILEQRVRAFGEDDPHTLVMARGVAFDELLIGDLTRAGPRYRQVLERHEVVLGPDHGRTLETMNGYAEALMELGRHRQAERVQAEVVERYRNFLAPDDAVLLTNLGTWAAMLRRAGHHRKAYEHSRYVWEQTRELQGEGSDDAMYAATVHARSLHSVARFDEALALATRVAEHCSDLLGEEHPHVAAADVNRAIALRAVHRASEALELDRAALERLSDALGDAHPSTLRCLINVANDHFALGDVAAAHRIDEHAFTGCLTELGERHPLSLSALRNLLLSRKALGEDTESEYGDLEIRHREVMGAEHPSTLSLGQEVRRDADIHFFRL